MRPEAAGDRRPVLGILPGLGQSLRDLERQGQLDRLLRYYFPAYLRAFSRLRYFTYEPERIDDYTEDGDLLRRVEVVAPPRHLPRRARALEIVAGRGRALLRECALLRALHAPGAVPAALSGVPYACTYGYSYPQFTTLPFDGLVAPVVLRSKQAVMRQGLRFVLRRARLTIVTSDTGELEARALGAREVRRIPNGVDVQLFRPRRVTPEYDVGFVGRLEPQKDLGTLLEAVATLEPPVRVCLIGDGSERDRLARAAAARGVDMTFLGARPQREVAWLLARCRSFVLPSLHEGHPKALLEAMAAGVPSIAADIDGVRELARDGGVLVFPRRDADALARLLRRVLGDDAEAARLAAAARKLVESRFDLGRLLETETALLSSLASASRRDGGRVREREPRPQQEAR